MAEDFQVGVGGAWKSVNDVQVGVGGAWKSVSEMYVGVSGVWKRFYSAFTASLSGTFNFVTGAGLVEVNTSTTSITVNISDASTLECTVSGTGSSLGIQKNGTGPFLSSQTVSDGDTIKARLTTGALNSTIYTCIVTMETYGSKTFSVETADV